MQLVFMITRAAQIEAARLLPAQQFPSGLVPAGAQRPPRRHDKKCFVSFKKNVFPPRLETALAKGHTRAIGVSNFDSSQLATLLQGATVKPVRQQLVSCLNKKTSDVKLRFQFFKHRVWARAQNKSVCFAIRGWTHIPGRQSHACTRCISGVFWSACWSVLCAFRSVLYPRREAVARCRGSQLQACSTATRAGANCSNL